MSGSHNTHMKRSPSGSERWAVCTASEGYVEHLVKIGELGSTDSPTNEYGLAGTYAHDVSEEAILHLIGKKVSGDIDTLGIDQWLAKFICDPGHHAHWVREQGLSTDLAARTFDYMGKQDYSLVQNYVDECLSHRESKADLCMVEVQAKVFYGKSKDDTGTCDFLMLKGNGDVVVRDLKWRKEAVTSIENTQLAIYAKSVIDEYRSNPFGTSIKGHSKVNIGAYNPRVSNGNDEWLLTVDELNKFCYDNIQKQSDDIDKGNTTFCPTEKACKWCPAKKHCKARAKAELTHFPNDFSSNLLTDEQKVSIIKSYPLLEKMAKEYTEEMLPRLQRGEKIKGVKLGTSRANRVYKDPVSAASFCAQYLDHEEVYKKPEIYSMTHILSKLKSKDKKLAETFEKEYLHKPKGKAKVVVEKHKSKEAPPTHTLKGFF